MYSVLIYIVIVFIFILFTKDIRKNIEGQTLESYNYLEFQPIINNDTLDEQLKEHLNKYSGDIDDILKQAIDNSDIKNDLALLSELKEYENEDIDSNDAINVSKENLLYDIYIRDVLGESINFLNSEESYDNYLKHYVKFHEEDKISKNIPYSDDQAKLFSKIYKPNILPSNEMTYVNQGYYDNIIKEKKEDELFLPGLIDTVDDQVLNNMSEYDKDLNNSDIDISNAEFCCDYSALRIDAGPPILSEDEILRVNKRINDLSMAGIEEEKNEEGVHAYNYPYYEYMKGQGLLYKPLYLNYDKTRNIGDINI